MSIEKVRELMVAGDGAEAVAETRRLLESGV